MEGTEVLMHKEGDRLVLTPIRNNRLLDLLASWKTLDGHDLFIAAHARSRGMTLVTHNMREFERVPGLRVEDWLTVPA